MGSNTVFRPSRLHQLSYRRFAGYAAIAVSVALAPLLIWKLSDILLLGFGGIMIASLLRLIAGPIRTVTRLPASICLALSGLVILGAIGGTAWLFETRAAGEFKETFDRVLAAGQVLEADLNRSDVGHYLLEQAKQTNISMTAVVERFLMTSLSTIEALILVVIVAIFMAAQPAFYEEGILMLFPRDQRPRLRAGLSAMGNALRLWMMGQLVSMAVIGILAGTACWLIGLRTPYALGLIAGLAEFLPYVGPIISAVPALLVALTQHMDAVWWTAGAYLLIHQIEGNILMPVVQRWVVSAPPALMLMGIAFGAALFGIYGLIFAAPLVIVILTGVQALYVQDVLEENIDLPADSESLEEKA